VDLFTCFKSFYFVKLSLNLSFFCPELHKFVMGFQKFIRIIFNKKSGFAAPPAAEVRSSIAFLKPCAFLKSKAFQKILHGNIINFLLYRNANSYTVKKAG